MIADQDGPAPAGGALPDLDTFNARIKPGLCRLPGCTIYVPDEKTKSGWRKLDGGRAVYVQNQGDTTGLAIVSRAVALVSRVDYSRWNVQPAPATSSAPDS